MKFCISFDSASKRNLVFRVGVVTLLVERLLSTLESALGSAFLEVYKTGRECTPVILAQRRWRQENQEFEVIFGYTKKGVREKEKEKKIVGFRAVFDFIPACSAFAWPLGGTVAYVRREVLLILPDTVTWGTMSRAGVPESVQEHTLEFRGLAFP